MRKAGFVQGVLTEAGVREATLMAECLRAGSLLPSRRTSHLGEPYLNDRQGDVGVADLEEIAQKREK